VTFFGNLHDLHDMQQAASSDVLAKHRPQSVWIGRDSEHLDDPEDPSDDPCQLVHEFSLRQDDRWDLLVNQAFEAEQRAEDRWRNQLHYDEFLRSDYWEAVRRAVLARDGHKCRFCGATQNLQVHHRWYPPRGTEMQHLDALILLCSKCHHEQHR